MALTQGARNKIKSFVQSAKRLLMKEFADQIQQYYGIRLDGSYLMVEELTTKDGSVIQTARLLRDRLDYLEDTIAGSNKKEEAVEQLVREQAFTILNRFAALRMAEERQIIPETIKQGYNSEGFQVFDQLSGGAQTAEQFERYNWFLKAMFDELAIDLPAVFDRFSPYALLFPSEKVMLELLDIINDEDLSIYREEGQQPMNLWEEDETIGWVYQYYNSREEISAMREASGAPRNSRELAVRNQFFTPRYVVQFLVDNSLGRQWFEMTKGQTSLVNDCQYMVKREQEIFLDKGEVIPEAKIEGANYIEYRALKDPREILMLDPACGSMHFGLYCFDLFEQIYIEAWDNHPELMPDLRDKYLREDYIKRIPGYILQYNIHGVDIDPRAIQIAGLSLWLRAQKSYKKLGLQPANRPMIKKSNLVVAEPMPGDAELLSEFTRSLPGPIGKLVRVIWEKMQLAGETGLLLKIEEELKHEIELAKEEYKQYKGGSTQTSIFGGVEDAKAAEMAAIYGKDQKITKDFFDTAEEEVLKALQSFSENAEGEHAFQKLLFAEDTARGFAFIELSRKRYDVIVMNPPFGAASINTEKYFNNNYSDWTKNLINVFISRMKGILNDYGELGFIIDNSIALRSTYAKIRQKYINGYISYLVETGWGVLDANVETTTLVVKKNLAGLGFFIQLSDNENKQDHLHRITSSVNKGNLEELSILNSIEFNSLPNKILGYYINKEIYDFFIKNSSCKQIGLQARKGHNLKSEVFHRMFWEVIQYSNIKPLYNGGQFSLFYYPSRRVTKWYNQEWKLKNSKSVVLRNIGFQEMFGIGYGQRGDFLDLHLLKKGFIFTNEGQAINGNSEKLTVKGLLYLNSILPQYLVNLYTSQHKEAGYVNLIPVPDFVKNEENIDFDNRLLDLINAKRKWFCFDETTLEFKSIVSSFIDSDNFMNSLNDFNAEYEKDYKIYKSLVNENDLYWLKKSGLSNPTALVIEKEIENRTGDIFDSLNLLNQESRKFKIVNLIIQEIIGISFDRYVCSKKQSVSLKFSSISEAIEKINLDELNIIEPSSSSQFYENSDLLEKFKYTVQNKLKLKTLIDDLENFTEIGDIYKYFINSSGFFNFHLNHFSHNRREAPIYWPIATKSNSYIIWIYYPALNENTLYSIINELVDPKLLEIKKLVVALEMSSASKDLHEQMALRDELVDFKEELLRVAQLPYKPNQDDGVLITAAPLHNLFRHTKWLKSTEACWEKLEKGEYDWAHLSYSIWPDRVTNKCKKDLSMAIAHGLESICEIKPKEKKSRQKPEIKVETQDKLL